MGTTEFDNRVIADIENRAPFKVLPWQYEFLAEFLNPDIDTHILSIARGAGKTALVSLIAACYIDGPLYEISGEDTSVVIVASSFEQARTEMIKDLRKMLPDDDDGKHFRIVNNTALAEINNRKNGARIKFIGSDAKRAHGKRATVIICDELAQWQPNSGEAMWVALTTGLGKVDNQNDKVLAVSTRPASFHWFESVIQAYKDEPTASVILYCAPKDCDINHPSSWHKANPSLAYGLPKMKEYEKHCRLANKIPRELASFKAYKLNMGEQEISGADMLLGADEWDKLTAGATRDGEMVWGLDLGGATSFSAVAAYWPETGRLEAYGAIGDNLSPYDRGLKDRVGSAYVDGVQHGEIILLPNEVPRISDVLLEAHTRYGGWPKVIACDRYRAAELRDAIREIGATMTVEHRRMGIGDGSEDVARFRAAVSEGRLKPEPNVTLTNSIAAATVGSRSTGAQFLSNRRGQAWNYQNDVAVAAILATAEGDRRAAKPRNRQLAYF